MSQTQKPFIKGYKYRVYPNAEQIELFSKTFGCCRFVYNRALAEAQEEHKQYLIDKIKKPKVSGFDFVNKLVEYKSLPELSFLKEVDSHTLQHSMQHLGKAYSTFFKNKKGFPQFKSRHSKQSFTITNQHSKFKDNEFYISKCKTPLDIRFDRPLPGIYTSANLSKTPSGKYFISFTCEYIPIKTNGIGNIGIDLGLKDFLITSDGIKVPNPKYFIKSQKTLKRKQQSLSRKQKGSNNRNKARLKVSLIHDRIANQRNDFLHKLSTTLINENQVISIESLVIRNMVKNRKLSKAISDVAWSKFKEMLLYKANASQHCKIVSIDTFFPSSNLCNVCFTKRLVKLKLSQRQWTCPCCNTVHDRDINAAINIKNEGNLILHSNIIPNNITLILG